MAGNSVDLGSVYATLELKTQQLSADVARAQAQFAALGGAMSPVSASASKMVTNIRDSFAGVADSIGATLSTILKGAVLIGGTGALALGTFINTARGLQTTNLQMQALVGSTEDANKVYGELYNYVLGKPIAFPDAAKAASTLLGYGRSVNQVIPDMKTLSTLAIVNGADLGQLSNVFGQITSRGALFGQDALQLINNKIPLTNILAKSLGVSIEEAATKIQGGQISAEQFTKAMDGYAKSLDITKFSDSFDNRVISMQGSIRAFGNAILGIKIDPVRGLIIESGGLFDRFSKGISDIGPKLKSLAPLFKDIFTKVADNIGTIVSAIGALVVAFAAAKLGEFAANLVLLGARFLFLTGSMSSATAAQWGFNIAADANPIGLIVTAVVALIGVLAFLVIRFNLITKALKVLKPIFEDVKTVVRLLFDTFTGGDPTIKSSETRFEGLSKVLTKVADVVRPLIHFVGEQLKSAFESLQSIWAQLIKAMQPLIDLFKEFWEKHGKQVIKILEILGVVVAAIVLAPLVAGFALLIAGAKILAVVLKFVADHFDVIKKIVIVFMAIALAPLIISIALVVVAVKVLIAIFKAVVEAVKATINFFEAVGNAVSDAAKAIGDGFNSAKDGVVKAFNAIKNFIVKVWQDIYNATIGPLTAIGNFILGVLDFIKNLFVIVFGSILLVVLYAVGFIKDTIIAVFTAVYNFLVPIVTAIWNFLVTAFNTIKDAIVGAVQAIWDGIVIVWNGIVAFLTPIVQAVWDFLVGAWNGIKNTVVGAVQAIWDFMVTAWNAIYAAVSGVVQKIIDFFAPAVTWLLQKGKDIITGLINGIKAMADALWNGVKFVGDKIGDFFKGAGSWLYNVGSDIIQGLINGIKSMVDKVKNAAGSVGDAVKSKLKSVLGIGSPSRITRQYGVWIGVGFNQGVEGMQTKIAKTIDKTFGLSSPLTDVSSTLTTSFANQQSNLKGTAVQQPTKTTDQSNSVSIYGNISIGNQQDADYLLQRLSRRQDLTAQGLVGAQ